MAAGQDASRQRHARHRDPGLVTLANAGTALLEEPVLADIAGKHGRTPGQVVLRWHVQLGVSAVPKSTHPDRLRANLEVFDFELDDDDLSAIAGLDTGAQVGDQDPATHEEY